MSTETNKQITRRFWTLYLREDYDTILNEILAPELVVHFAGMPDMDVNAFRGLGQMYKAAFPDLNIMVEDEVAEGTTVASRIRIRGTHNGSLMGILPTSKQVDYSGVTINRIRDGKIIERWDISDMMSAMQQLGVIPPLSEEQG